MIYDSQHPLNTDARSFRRLLEADCEKVNTLNRGIELRTRNVLVCSYQVQHSYIKYPPGIFAEDV